MSKRKLFKKNKASLLEETKSKEFMTDAEKFFHKKLYNLLRDDGKGHHHATYAKVFDAYPLSIVPIGQQPATAAISYDDKIIYVNQGFLVDPQVFSQLNVIIRHELLHNLLMHQVRMIKKLSTQIPEAHLKLSSSIHEICNILEDFEISNKKYSEDDKKIVRNTWINGKLISGLVTEDHRSNWATMPLEDMWDAFMAEMAATNFDGNTQWADRQRYDATKGQTVSAVQSNLEAAADKLTNYKHKTKHASFDSVQELADAILGPAKKEDPNVKMPSEWQEIFDGLAIIEDDPNIGYTHADLEQMMDTVTGSAPLESVDIVSPVSGEVFCTVYSPEEKNIALEILKIMNGDTAFKADYDSWYKEVQRVAKENNLTDDEIKDLLQVLD